MKKLFLLLITLSTFAFPAIDDCKTDVYFGNGILTEPSDAQYNTGLLEESIKQKFGLPYFNKNIGKVDYAYNSTEGEVGDVLESLAQKLENSVISYLPYVAQVSLLLNIATAESQNRDVGLQVEKYRNSIKGGNKVLLVAHSQGNLFGRKALITLTQNPKDFWMGNYFEAVSVASPMVADIKSDTPRIDWDNDIVSAIALGVGGGAVENPVRYLRWSLIRPDIGIAWRENIPNAHAWKSQIGGLTPKGHWKSNSSLGLSSVVHAFTFYMGEPLAERNYFDNTEMNSSKARDKILLAIDAKLNNGKQCPCSKAKEPIQTEKGAIEVTLSWTCGNNIDMDLLLSGPNVQVDVNDGDSDFMEHAYVATQAEIKPGDKFVALGRGEKKPESDLEDSALEDNPIDVYAVVKTPGGSKFKHYEVKTFEQLNLGEFAEIEVKDKRYEISDYSGYSSPYQSYVRTYNECDDEDKKHTCGCVPCEYIIHGMDGAVEYGPIGGADVEVIRADTYGSANPIVVYRGKTTNDSDLFKSGLVKFTQSDYDKFEEDVYYVVDAKGGNDLDRDDDLVKDVTPTQNNGTIHAIISGADLKTVAFRVNALTEAIYQTSGDLLGSGYDVVKLDEKLGQAAKKLFREKTFIFNNELEINYHDALLWAPGVDKKKLFKPYDTFVEPIVVKTYADQARVKESYRLIYEKLDTDAPQLKPLALEIPHTIPSGSIIGKVSIESEGVSGIDHIELHGDANSSFSIDKEGLIKVVDNSEFIIDAIYKLDMTAVGSDAKRSISMELVVKVIEGIPLADPSATVPTLESVVLEDIIENSVGGTVVGQANFVDSSLNIVSYILSGEDNSSFSIDNTGEITVADGADIDYEKSDTYTVKVSAVNEAGNESFPVALSFNVINEIDTPLHDLVYLTHLSENVPIGTVVGEIVQLREGRSPITSFDILNPNVPFALDVNGTIRTTGYINYEDVDEYNLLAIAKTDSGNGNKVDLQILIDDVYPETGNPTMQPFTANIDENANTGVVVGQLSISQGASAVEQVELRGTGHSNFTVDVNGTIHVASAATLDYEEKNSYSLQAIAHNANGSSDLVSVNIALNNVEDEAPTLLSLTKSIEENATVNTVVGTLRVASSGEGNITDYTLTGTGSENYSIDENGTIRVSSSATLDYETTPGYTLQATVMSDVGESDAVVVRIFILNVPEHVPVLKPFTGSVEENASIGTIVGQIEEDIGGDSPIVSFALDDNSTFSIDAHGTIRLNATLDYELQTTYTLAATASNVVGESSPATVSINITNIIDDEPVLNEATFSIEENAAVGTTLGTVAVNSTGTSAITSMRLEGVGAEKFSIDGNGTLKLVEMVDYESKKVYHLHAIATNDKADSPEVSVVINILNVAEHVPVLYAFKGFVEDNATTGTVIGDVQFASRGDSLVNGFVLSGTGHENFSIDVNGTISVSDIASLNEAIQKVYTLQVSASNEAGTSAAVEASIVLTHDKNKPYKPNSMELLDIGHNSITLGWVDNAQNERGYNLYVDGVLYATLGANTTSYRVTGLTEETTYIFTLKSFNDRGESIGTSIEGITDIDRSEYLKAILGQKCGVASSTFEAYFNRDTGHYSQSIDCSSRGLTDADLENFKALKSVQYSLTLNNNNLTNVDGLSNLKSVGYHLYLYNNQLTNVDGLSKLETVTSYDFRLENNQLTNVNGLSALKTVGRYFYLNNNQLTNVNGLSSLTSVGNLFYLQDNFLTNVDGLSALTNVGNNFNLERNQLTNLNGLNSLTNLGGYLALRNNASLTDISGVSNIVGSDGKILYITPGQYTTKANSSLKFCSATWDLKDMNGDIDDDMTLVCAEGATLTEPQQLRAIVEQKCSVTYAQFAAHFDEETGVYDTSLDCSYNEMTDEDLLKFSILNEIQGSFSINDNNLTNLDGLSNLRSIGGYFYLDNNSLTDISGLSSLISVNGILDLSHNNMFNLDGLYALTTVQGAVKMYYNNNLVDITGISNIIGLDGKKIYIDPVDYSTKVDSSASFCASKWDIYDTTGNILDDMTKLCEGYDYEPNSADKLRDLLGQRCAIDSSIFYDNFAEDSGIYNGDIKCQAVTDEEMIGFAGLLEVHGSFAVEDSNITTVDELIRLKSVSGALSIQHNANLIDIDGLSNVLGVANKKLIIDDTNQYNVKADPTLDFCLTSWDIYNGSVNIGNDMLKVCNP